MTHTLQGFLSSNDVAMTRSNGTTIGAAGTLNAVSTYKQAIGATTGDSTSQFDAQPGHADYVHFQPSDKTVTATGSVASTYWAADPENGIAMGYVGIGTFGIDFNANQLTNINGVGGVAQSSTPSLASGSVSVTYTFDAVPEPTTMVLCVGGVGMLVIGQRIRRHIR